MAKVSIIIPAYNIKPNVDFVAKCMQGIEHEIIVENDKYGVGKGATLQRALERCSGEKIVWLDADMQISPRYIPEFLKVDVDVVVASKLHPLSKMDYSLFRRIATFFSTLTMRVLFNLPIRDSQAGLKIFRREVLNEDYRIPGFGHDIEVLMKAYNKGYTIVEMPVTIKKSKQSSVNLRGCIRTFFELFWLRVKLGKRKKK